MKIIVGLGNVGKDYEGTRHNAGFMFADELAAKEELAPVDGKIEFKKEKKFDAEVAETIAKGEKIILVKPTTFMNNSGQAVAKIMQFYKAETSELIVIADDIDLPVGMVRIRLHGSSGGHKGIQSVIDNMKTDEFARIRIGVNSLDENRRTYETNRFVLARPSKREQPILEQSIAEAVKFLSGYIGTKEPIPAHTLEITFDSIK